MVHLTRWSSAVSFLALFASLQAQPGEPAAIRYIEVQVQPILQSVELSGTVVSRKVSTVAGEVAGLVLEFPVREGEKVIKGQVLAHLRQDRIDLMLQAAEAQLAEDESRRKLAELNLQRSQELFEKNVLSRQDLDNALYEHRALGNRMERLQAEIANLQDQIEHCTIKAPFDGVIVQELTQVGEWLDSGGAVVELLSVEDLEVVVPVPERYFGSLSRRSPARIRFESLPELDLSASITAVIPRADPQARTFPVKIGLPQPDRRLGAGMIAQVTLRLGSTYQATMVPKDALVRQGTQEFVYIINGDNTVRMVGVESGAGVGSWVEIRGGVSRGDRVVTRGNERLRPGQAVVAQPLEVPFP